MQPLQVSATPIKDEIEEKGFIIRCSQRYYKQQDTKEKKCENLIKAYNKNVTMKQMEISWLYQWFQRTKQNKCHFNTTAQGKGTNMQKGKHETSEINSI